MNTIGYDGIRTASGNIPVKSMDAWLRKGDVLKCIAGMQGATLEVVDPKTHAVLYGVWCDRGSAFVSPIQFAETYAPREWMRDPMGAMG